MNRIIKFGNKRYRKSE